MMFVNWKVICFLTSIQSFFVLCTGNALPTARYEARNTQDETGALDLLCSYSLLGYHENIVQNVRSICEKAPIVKTEHDHSTQTSKFKFDLATACGDQRHGYKFSEITAQCFKLYELSAKTWRDAKATCEKEGSYLAMVHYGLCDDWKTIADYPKESSYYRGWRPDARHSWASLQLHFKDGLLSGRVPTIKDELFICEKNSIIFGCPDEPTSESSTTSEPEYSTVVSNEIKHTSTVSKSVNVTALTTECWQKNGYEFSEQTGHCYKFHAQTVRTWYDAMEACEKEGAYLAIVNSGAEAQVLAKIFSKYPEENINGNSKDTAAIGFYSKGVTDFDQWVTIHGDTLKQAGYASWKPNKLHPWAKYGNIYRDGLLSAYVPGNYENVPYICEKEPTTNETSKQESAQNTEEREHTTVKHLEQTTEAREDRTDKQPEKITKTREDTADKQPEKTTKTRENTADKQPEQTTKRSCKHITEAEAETNGFIEGYNSKEYYKELDKIRKFWLIKMLSPFS